jgi:uncharacterized membrane protein YbhN (UPF0104 family)
VTWQASRKGIDRALTAVGALLLIYLLRRVGFAVLWVNLTGFGPWFLVTGAIAGGWLLLQAIAWWVIQKQLCQRVALSELWRAKIISDGFNMVLPSASAGGDAMRAFLIRARVPLADGIPAVVFDKTIEFAASVVFLAPVLLLGLLTIRLPAALVILSGISLVGAIVGVVLLVTAQKKGIFTVLLRMSRLVPGTRDAILRRQEPLLAMDANFRVLHAGGASAALVPLALHVLARLVGGLEVIVAMAVLGAPVTGIEALFICAVVTVGNTIFFLLPGQWGVTESVHVLVVQSLGYPPAIGLSLSLIRRIRRLAFVGLALALHAVQGRSLALTVEANGSH